MQYCDSCHEFKPGAPPGACPDCGYPLEDRPRLAAEAPERRPPQASAPSTSSSVPLAPTSPSPVPPPPLAPPALTPPVLPPELDPGAAPATPAAGASAGTSARGQTPGLADPPQWIPSRRAGQRVSAPEDASRSGGLSGSEDLPGAEDVTVMMPVVEETTQYPVVEETTQYQGLDYDDLLEDIRQRGQTDSPPDVEEATAPEWESPDAREAYQQVVARVGQHMAGGYDLFGFVGHSNSGKTHCLKALDRILRFTQGEGAGKAQSHFDQAHVPGPSRAEVFDYVYTSDTARWVFIDAGGELYASMQEGDWSTTEARQAELTRWLHHCKGLFMFLHLNKAHLDPRLLSTEQAFATLETPEQAERRVQKARAAQRELTFFRNFLLFLRAVKAEDGDVAKIFSLCRQTADLEEALRDYAHKTPLLDIPVMFFFTKADSYGSGFEIADGIHFTPQEIPMGPMIFTARYLPVLFKGLLQHVRRFKFDFLQSHVEYPVVRDGKPVLDESGRQEVSVHWNADPETPLSVGLLPGLEFILRNQQRGRRLWRGPGIDTRTSLLIHRQRHPKLWKDVNVDLGTWGQAWRSVL